ncbi:hypothetical protein SY88_21610 [Clostridiales bacterium PH28_bin88]|nr:hypothetical protein SY88_21610 [Clostridiales bacterium PH28_bin88]
MHGYDFNSRAVYLARLSEEYSGDLANFDCGDPVMNEFLCTQAMDEQEKGMNHTILLYYYGELAAFCSICADSIRLAKSEKETENVPYEVVPAIKIARLGRSTKHKGLGLGRFLIDYVKDIADDLTTSTLGIRFLTLDSYPDRVEYYRNLGFLENEAYKRRTETVSMRADIFDEE